MKVKSMSVKQLIAAVQKCLANGDTGSTYFHQLNNALPERYRIA